MSEQISEVTDEAFEAALVDDAQTDVPVADEPAPSSENVVVANEAEEPEGEAAPADEKPEEPSIPETPEKTDEPLALDWKSAPDQFRENYNNLKKQYEEASSNSLQEKFFTDPEAFLETLSGLSTSQFQQTTQQIVQKGIEAFPDEFADYMAQTKPDAVVKALANIDPNKLTEALDLGMPANKVRKIINQVKSQDLEGYLDENAGEPEKPEAPKAKADSAEPMTPEEIDKIVEQKITAATKPKEIEKLKGETFAEIMAPVEALIEEAGLKPLPTDSDQERAYKQWAYKTILRDTFDYLHEDEKNKPRAQKMYEMIDGLDAAGVKYLSATAKILAEDFAGKQIELLTGQRAKTQSKGTEAKKKDPPKVIPSSGAVPAFGNQSAPLGPISEISDAEFERAGM
jgi:hypothetical protein